MLGVGPRMTGQACPTVVASRASVRRTIAIALVIAELLVVVARAGVEQIAPAIAAVARQRPHALLIVHEITVGAATAAAAIFGAPPIGIVSRRGLGRRGRGRYRNGREQSCENKAHGSLLNEGAGPRDRRGGHVRHLLLCVPLRFIPEIAV